jgi:hypothetical protein
MKLDMTALHQLVAALDQARPMTAPPVWIRICGPVARPDKIEEEVGFDRLVGFVAPKRCSAVGVVAGGWATTTADADRIVSGGSRSSPRERVRSTVVVQRDGSSFGRLRWASGRVVDEAPTYGRMFDCLRRAVGLATEPPAVGTDILFASMWLLAITEAADRPASALTWLDVAALHPVSQILEDEVPDWSGGLVDAARALAVACPWSEVRRLIAEGAWAESPVRPSAAAWMDDGMLCRWLLDGQATLALQLRRAADELAPPLARRVGGTLRELGLAIGEHQYL